VSLTYAIKTFQKLPGKTGNLVRWRDVFTIGWQDSGTQHQGTVSVPNSEGIAPLVDEFQVRNDHPQIGKTTQPLSTCFTTALNLDRCIEPVAQRMLHSISPMQENV